MLQTLNQSAEAFSQELKEAKSNLIPLQQIGGFSGFRKHSINLIGAIPFVDVTNFLLSIASALARKGERTLFVSTHLAENEIVKRLYALAMGISASEVISSLRSKIESSSKAHNNLFIHELGIDEQPSITIPPLLVKHKIENLIIDTTQEEVYDLLAPNVEKTVTLFIGKFLGKSVDKNSDGLPRYKDFLKRKINMKPVSVVVGIARPEIYNIVMDENGESTEGVAKLIIIKSPFEEANASYTIKQDAHFQVW